jgi:DNA (cytosine-5)-methyltransferase 1
VRPLLLDLYCGAGGAAVGYHRAGFDVVGVDINPQPNYPFTFVQWDAIEYLEDSIRTGLINWFSGIHASPPCQHYSGMSNCRPGLSDTYPDLVGETRDRLHDIGLPWVMENVAGSALLSQPSLFSDLSGITLCGHMFGLRLYRHRLFESNIPLVQPPHPRHLTPASKAGHWAPGTIISVSGDGGPGAREAREAMGVDWMTRHELSESIPPAFTKYIGAQLIDALKLVA